MTDKIIKSLAALLGAALLFAACGKDDANLIVGKWTNTAQSNEITIAGQAYIPEGYICMKFTDSKVLTSDYRRDCLAQWHRYTLKKESGKLILNINEGCIGGIFVVEELTSDKLVLVPKFDYYDWDFKYIMKRQ